MADRTVELVILLLLIVAIAGLVLALRHRLAWRIAMRNVRRARGRTALVILGLLVGTTIISGSLVVGSTLSTLELHYTYIGVGNVHEAIYEIGPTGGYRYFDYTTYEAIANGSAANSNIAGITPMIIDSTQVFDRTTGVPETALNLVASNANQSSNLGAFTTTSGATSSGPGPGQSFLDVQTAQALNASVGDTLVVYGPVPVVTTVAAIVVDDARGGFLTAGLTPGNVFVDLTTAQTTQNESGQVNFVAVTNVGGQVGGLAHTGSVSASLNATLAGIPAASGLVVHNWMQNAVNNANSASTSVETLFLVLGLFSIAAGAMLIVGIFLTLAEERKGEMGMLRAIGLGRRDLVYTYYFEGLAYAAGSALAGTVLGVVAGYVLVYLFSETFSSSGLSSSAILSSFTFTGEDLAIAYVAGFLLTLITIVIASSRVSRLNIVSAIRDIPPTPPPRRVYRLLAYVGILVAVLGLLILIPTARGTSDISYPLLGGALTILGLGLVGSNFVRNRIVFSVVGLALLLWAGLEPIHHLVLGTAHTGGIFVIFVEGILMVAGALLLYIFNATAVTAGLLSLAGGRNRPAPVARIALAYPSRRPGRTSVNLTIFALVIFTMVAIACFGATVQSNLNSTIQTQSGGYTFFGSSSLPIPDIDAQIANNTTLNRDFSVAVPIIAGAVRVAVPGSTPNPYTDTLLAAPGNQSPTSNFYTTNQFGFSATWDGLTTAEVWQQLADNGSVAVVDQSYAPATVSVTGGAANHPTLKAGTVIGLTAPGGNTTLSVRVIGIMSQSALSGVWINPGTAVGFGYSSEVGFLLTVRPGISADTASQDAKRAFFSEGLTLYDITAILQTSIASTEGFVNLLEIFVGLGLAVGIAAMGILALRAVVERKREIGMLRAMGFTEGGILKAFFLEFSFVTVLGLAIGTALGIWIVYDLSVSPAAAASGVSNLAVPGATLLLILGSAYLLSMLAIALPSLRASRLPPADSVRSTE